MESMRKMQEESEAEAAKRVNERLRPLTKASV